VNGQICLSRSVVFPQRSDQINFSEFYGAAYIAHYKTVNIMNFDGKFPA
jgi:hypothetical protein